MTSIIYQSQGGLIRSAFDAVELGKNFLEAKRGTANGVWRDRLTQLGIEPSTATRYMRSARRFSDAPEPFLRAIGCAGKLCELLPLHDEALAVVLSGREGFTLDVLARHSIASLRAALMPLRGPLRSPVRKQKVGPVEKLSASKVARIDALAKPTAKASPPPDAIRPADSSTVTGASPASAVSKTAGRTASFAEMWAKHAQVASPSTAADALALGAQLVLLREAAPNGRWRDHVNVMGLTVATAEQYVTAARRFGALPETFLAAAGSATKLLTLLALSTAEVEALVAGSPIQAPLGRSAPVLDLQQVAVLSDAGLLDAIQGLRGKDRPQPSGVPLAPDEEAMLRNYRKCPKPAQALLLQTAQMLAGQAQIG